METAREGMGCRERMLRGDKQEQNRERRAAYHLDVVIIAEVAITVAAVQVTADLVVLA
jgi:hypothetical protein